MVLGGDIFDKIPSLEELALFFEFLYIYRKPLIIYSGNHEATTRGSSILSTLKDIIEKVHDEYEIVVAPKIFGDIQIVPYEYVSKFKTIKQEAKILCTHIRGAIPPHVTPEIDLNLLDKWDTVLSGDLHSHANSQRNIIYPGSPLTVTFHRNKVKNGAIVFNTESSSYDFIEFNLPQLLRKTADSEEDIVEDTYNHVMYDISSNATNIPEDKVYKKVSNKTYVPELELSNLQLIDELNKYWTTILNIENTHELRSLYLETTKNITI